MNKNDPKSDRKDNNRVSRWLIAVVILLIAGALLYNVVSRERTGPLPSAPPASGPSSTPNAPSK